MIKLKSCPFCGEKDLTIFSTSSLGFKVCVQCNACGASIQERDEVRTIEAWNRRADGWIPIGEIVPEKRARYSVTVKEGDRFYIADALWNGSGWTRNTVVAWMPMIEPYKGESNG